MAASNGKHLTGRNIRWYANGQPVGISRMKMLKPSSTTGLDRVLECGNPKTVEYVKKVPETSIMFDLNVLSYRQLAVALGQTIGLDGTGVGEVPPLPDNFDIVERLISPGTEGTTAEVVFGYAIYQGIQVEKDDFDQEVDKLISRSVTAKAASVRRFDGVNGIQFDKFIGDGATVSFPLTKKTRQNADGLFTVRVENPLGFILAENFNYTVSAPTASTSAITFTTAPASSTAISILAVYVY